MSNYDKLIKQATKPKRGAPKAKYIDPIIASSFSQDGSLQDICRALTGRLQDTSGIVVFKSLIVIHTLIRNGGVDNVLTHLAGNQGSLKLRNVVAGGNWQGYDTPQMLSHYAAFIEERIKAFKELRRDCIRTSESGRGRPGKGGNEGAGSGHRLRRLTVDKGLLREVAIAQKVCSRLLDLFFSYFSDNTQDEMALTAFRMALKDMLALYAAINEGVINILEHYFEMSKPDAERALDIYKRFCTHTEKIVAYMSNAKKVSYSLNVPIPNLKHAPVSLAGALKEYLEDPNFEQNRLEYKENKRVADSGGVPVKPKVAETKGEETRKGITIKEPSSEEKTKPVKPPTSNQALQDFFESIETDQMTMFPGAQQQQQQQQQMPMMTGMPQMMVPQQTGYNPFMNGMNGGGFMPPQQTGYMQPQQTGFMSQQQGFLQPQMTGFNPFRQSVMMQPTGMQPANLNGFAPSSNDASSPGLPSSTVPSSSSNTRFASPPPPTSATARQANTTSTPAPLKPLSAQKTGSRNPFAPPPGETPPPTPPLAGPQGPSLRDLARGGAGSNQGPSMGGGGNYGLGAGAWAGSNGEQQQQQQQQQGTSHLLPQNTGMIGSVASEFVKGAPTSNVSGTASPGPGPTTTPSRPDLTSDFDKLSFQSSQASTSQAPLQAQATGLGGSLVRPFQPSSSFGASLTANGGASSSPRALSPSMTGNPFAQMGSSAPFSAPTTSQPPAPSQQPTSASNGSSFGSSLFATSTGLNGNPAPAQQPQSTGFGSSAFGSNNAGVAPQPTGFGQSLFSSPAGAGSPSPLTSQATGLGGSTVKPFQPTSAFGSSAFGNPSNSASPSPFSQPPPSSQQQQQHSTPAFTGSLF